MNERIPGTPGEGQGEGGEVAEEEVEEERKKRKKNGLFMGRGDFSVRQFSCQWALEDTASCHVFSQS